MSELPKGWAICSLADIGQIVTGKTPSTKEPRFYDGNIPFIKPGDLDHSGPIFRTESSLTDAGAAEVPTLPSQTTVVTCIGNLGKVGLTTMISASNQQINAVIPEEGINPSFLFHFCKTLKPWLESESSATTISIVNKGIFSRAPVPLAPLAEQTRIAQKLDALVAQVDTLKTRIDAIPTLLKRFRQSVLTAAISGRLTDEGSIEEPQQSWRHTPLKELGRVSTGSTPSKKDDENYGGEFLFVKPGDLDLGEILSTDERLTRKGFSASRKLRKGAVLVSCIGNLGKVGFAGVQLACNQQINAIEFDSEKVDDWYGYYACHTLKKWLKENSSATTIAIVNKGRFIEAILPVPPMAEQIEIVRRIEQLFSFADQIEAKVAAAKNRIDYLTQSILVKAFRGELVPQDPNDEPASVLLERIKAQRAAAPKTKRGRKST